MFGLDGRSTTTFRYVVRPVAKRWRPSSQSADLDVPTSGNEAAIKDKVTKLKEQVAPKADVFASLNMLSKLGKVGCIVQFNSV